MECTHARNIAGAGSQNRSYLIDIDGKCRCACDKSCDDGELHCASKRIYKVYVYDKGLREVCTLTQRIEVSAFDRVRLRYAFNYCSQGGLQTGVLLIRNGTNIIK